MSIARAIFAYSATGVTGSYCINLVTRITYSKSQDYVDITHLAKQDPVLWIFTAGGPVFAYMFDLMFRLLPAKEIELKNKHNQLLADKILRGEEAEAISALQKQQNGNPNTLRNKYWAAGTLIMTTTYGLVFCITPPVSVGYALLSSFTFGAFMGPIVSCPFYLDNLQKRQKKFNSNRTEAALDTAFLTSEDPLHDHQPEQHEPDPLSLKVDIKAAVMDIRSKTPASPPSAIVESGFFSRESKATPATETPKPSSWWSCCLRRR